MKTPLLLTITALALLGLILACAAPPSPTPTPLPPTFTPVPEPMVVFAKRAFPKPMPDRPWHHQAWLITDCMGCHGEEPGQAPTVKHKGLPKRLLEVNCRTCHVLISGKATPTPGK